MDWVGTSQRAKRRPAWQGVLAQRQNALASMSASCRGRATPPRPRRGRESPFPILNLFGHRNLATGGSDQGARETGFAPTFRAGDDRERADEDTAVSERSLGKSLSSGSKRGVNRARAREREGGEERKSRGERRESPPPSTRPRWLRPNPRSCSGASETRRREKQLACGLISLRGNPVPREVSTLARS